MTTTGPRRPWWSSAPEDDDGDTSRPGTPPPVDADHACQVCPVCAALRLAGEVKPELVVHLGEAVRHLTLAAKAVVDAHAAGFGAGGLEHIPLDDDAPPRP